MSAPEKEHTTRATALAQRPRSNQKPLPIRLRSVGAVIARRGLLLFAVPVVLGIEVAVMGLRGAQWRGDVVWTVDWLPIAFVAIGPVIAGLAAVDTARLGVGATHMSQNRVTRTPAFAVTAAYSTVLGAVHLAVLLGALAVSAPPVWDAFTFLAVVVQLLAVVLFVGIGSLVGRFVGPFLAGVTGALAAFLAVYLLGSPGEHVALLHAGGATVPRVGYAYDPGYLLTQGAMLLLVIAALLVVRPLEGHRNRQVRFRDVAVATAACAGAVALSMFGPGERLASVSTAPSSCGAVQSIPTCFYPQHERVAAAFQEQLWVLVEVANEHGYAGLLPERVEEASRTSVPMGPDTSPFYVMPEHLSGEPPTLWEIASGLVQPVHCEQVQGELPPSDRYWHDLDALTVTWVGLAEPRIGQEIGYFDPALTPEQATTLVEQFRLCTYPHF